MIDIVQMFKEKGNYNHPQPQGFVAVKQYIFAKSGDKRTLLLRFANESPLSIEEMEMLITELDKNGKVIDRRRITHSDLTVAPGSTYCPTRAVVVKNECVDIRVQVLSVRSGVYRYTSRGGRLVCHYDKQGVSLKGKKPKHGHTEVKTVGGSVGKALSLIAAIALVLIGVTAAMSRYHSNSLTTSLDRETSSYVSV